MAVDQQRLATGGPRWLARSMVVGGQPTAVDALVAIAWLPKVQ